VDESSQGSKSFFAAKTNTKENMKLKLRIITGASAAFLALTAVAQESRNPKTDRPQSRDQRMSDARTERLTAAAKSSDLIGMEVKNYQNEKLGKVEDIGVDLESGRIVVVLVSAGGFLGIGDRVVAVPSKVLHHDVAQKVVHLDADKEKLKAAPKFEMSKWSESFQAESVAGIYRHYGAHPYFMDRTDPPNPVRNPDGTVNRDRNRNENTSRSSTALGYVEKASKLKGMPVRNAQNEKLGDVDNLSLDLSAGRVVAVVISSGGFLGLGDELSAVPPTAFRFNPEHDALQLDVSKEVLASAPHFKANQWPDLAQPTYTEGVYRAYRVEPYFDRHDDLGPAGADNTARNVRDRDNRTLTPFDQGTSVADRETTAQIRKGVVAATGLSVNAQNVKIITNNGRVVLRGPVNSAEEKRRIGEIAAQIAKSENVDNQLEVTAPAK
jgi:sporulation protein YlmC with PRC-barrel domain